MNYLLFGVKLQLFREGDKKTQAYYAEKIGIKLKDYQALEQGQHEPRGGLVLRIQERTGKHFNSEDMDIELTAQERDKMLGRVQR